MILLSKNQKRFPKIEIGAGNAQGLTDLRIIDIYI